MTFESPTDRHFNLLRNPKEYTIHEILERLGGLVNKAQIIRNKIPIEIKRADARHVCLSGIQTSLRPLMLAFGAIECANQTIPNIELKKVCCIKNSSNKEILDEFDTFAKLNLLIFTHFRIESLFSNLLIAMDNSYNKRGFDTLTIDLFKKITLSDIDNKKNCLKAFSIIRNSLHNNSINKNDNFDKVIKGERFVFTKGKYITATIFDDILLIDYSLEIIEEIINSPEILALPAPIPDLFHVNLGYS